MSYLVGSSLERWRWRGEGKRESKGSGREGEAGGREKLKRREDILSACLISFPEFGTEKVGGSRHAIGASG